MKNKMFSLILCIASIAHCANSETYVPEENSRAYAVMVEAGAKLLEFDIIRAHIDVQEKILVADLQHEQFASSAGKALGILGPLEALAHGFDEVIPVFLVLQKEIKDNPINTTVVGKTQIAQALNGLVSMLASPEVLHVVLPPSELVGPAYLSAMAFSPTAKFAKTIQAIAHKKFMLQYCDENDQVLNEQKLSNEAHLFYSVVKQTVTNMFGDLMNAAVVTVPVVNVPAKIEPIVIADEKVKQTESQDKLQKAEAKAPIKEFSCADIEHRQDMLHQAILHDSTECIKQAVKNGADINQGQGDRSHLLWAVLLKKSNAIEALLELGAKDRRLTNQELAQYSIFLGDFKSAMLIAKKSDIDLKSNTFKDNKKTAQYNAYYGMKDLVMIALERNDIKSAISFIKMGAPFNVTSFSQIIKKIIDDICIPKVFSHCYNRCRYDACANNSDFDMNLVEELIQELIKHGGNPNTIWDADQIWIYQQERILKVFLKNGADPNYNIKANDMRAFKTPIIMAIEADSKNAMKILLDAGAKIFINNYQTNKYIVDQAYGTPGMPNYHESGHYETRPVYNVLEYALEYGNPEIVALLIEHGA